MIEHYIGFNLASSCGEEYFEPLVRMLRSRPYVDYAVLMANGPEELKPEPTREQLGIIGRERVLIDRLTKTLRNRGTGGYGPTSDWTSETKRGSYFEVLIHVDGEPTGHVARVTVELDRFDRELVESYQREHGLR